MDQTKQPGIRISQIFLAGAQFEHRANAMAVPPTTPVGDIPVEVVVSVGLSDDGKAGVMSVTLTSKRDPAALYQFKVEMVGVVEAEPESNMTLHEYITTAGPPMLYPYVREALSAITGRGRFGPIWLPPMNFVALTAQLKPGKFQSSLVAKDTPDKKPRKKKPSGR